MIVDVFRRIALKDIHDHGDAAARLSDEPGRTGSVAL